MQMPSPGPDRTDRTRPTLLARLRAHLRSRSRGQSLVEFGLILPIFLVLLATTLDLGRLAMARVTVTNAAREGAFQASKTPSSFSSGQPCNTTTNLVVCRVQLEAKNSGVSIASSDIALSCNLSGCPKQWNPASRVTVTVTGHFTLLTPILAVFFGNSQNITFTAASTTQIETLPPLPSGALATPTPTPTPSPSSSSSGSPTPSPTSGVCTLPSAGFTTDPVDPHISAGDTVKFTDTSTSPNCAIQSWVWDFGDGATAPGTQGGTVAHTYVVKGNYKVTLKVTNATGSNTTGGVVIHVQ